MPRPRPTFGVGVGEGAPAPMGNDSASAHAIRPGRSHSRRGPWQRPIAGATVPRPMAAKTAFTSKDLDDLRAALLKEQGELKAQLAELEESSFSTPQSD